jgi:hypothetical protein
LKIKLFNSQTETLPIVWIWLKYVVFLNIFILI